MGPFRNAREYYYSTLAEKYLEMICDGQLFSAYPVNVYLIFQVPQRPGRLRKVECIRVRS